MTSALHVFMSIESTDTQARPHMLVTWGTYHPIGMRRE